MACNYVYRACDLTSSASNTLIGKAIRVRSKEAIKSEGRKKSLIYYFETFPGDGPERKILTPVDLLRRLWVFELKAECLKHVDEKCPE